MRTELIENIQQLNPWLLDAKEAVLDLSRYIKRQQESQLLSKTWDRMWLVLTGPRQAGKTTLGKYLCQELLTAQRFTELVYLNCDYFEIRAWLNNNPAFIDQLFEQFNLTHPIIFIDEVQRLENAGLLLKAIVDLQLPIKMIASGSSQIEIKSQIQEYLTGRHLEALILPLSYAEIPKSRAISSRLLYGCYPDIVLSLGSLVENKLLLAQLFDNYISKDVVEILKVGKPDILRKLVTLLAHSSGQLVNYTQLSNDCRVSVSTICNYLAILEKTYVVVSVQPFSGNKRSEITSNPICYFIDNGFRNQALQNFTELEARTDVGLLVEGAVFQEIYKFRAQNFYDFNINFWRTTNGAEVDFVLSRGVANVAGGENIIPIEVKYCTLLRPQITRSFRSFLQTYQPQIGFYITKNFSGSALIENCMVYFVPVESLLNIFPLITRQLQLG